MTSPDSEKKLTYESLWFERVVTREASLGRKDPSITDLATELEGIVRSSGAFSWYGIVACINQNGTPTHTNVHLLRQTDAPLPEEVEIDIKLILDDIGLNFDTTSSIKFEHFLTERPEYTPEAFRTELMQRYNQGGEKWTMVYEYFPGNPSQ